MKKRLVVFFSAALMGIGAFAQKWYTPEVVAQANGLLEQMTLDEKLSMIAGTGWMDTHGVERLGVKPLFFSDGPQGLGSHGKTTAYPSTVLLAATWDEAMAYRYGTSLARDAKARGVNVLLGPAVNIYRAPMCGRNFEYMGEDPFLASRIAVEYIKGVQDNGVMATIKHFALNNSDYDRHQISNDADLRTLHEIYFPAFKAAVQEAGVGALMTSYNLINGVYTTESPWLLKGVLRGEWGFKGMVMSDWDATHHSIPAARSGLDLEMPTPKYTGAADMKYYMGTGDVTEEMIDEKVRHFLIAQIAFGFLDGSKVDASIPKDSPESDATALAVARDGIVLLKNKGNVLPVQPKKYKRIVVTGENAFGYVRGGGSGNVTPFHYVSLFDGIKKAGESAGVEVEYVDARDLLSPIFYTDASLSQKGFSAEYFTNAELKGDAVRKQVEKEINYTEFSKEAFPELPEQNFSASWSGVLCSDVSTTYEFSLGGDDGFRMYLDGKPVIDNWADGGYRTNTYKLAVKAGEKHTVKIDYYQKTGAAAVNFVWMDVDGKSMNTAMRKKLANADMIVACVGFNYMTEGEGFDRPFELSYFDRNLLSCVNGSGKPVVGVLNSGGSVEMQSWEPGLKGLVWLGYAGQQGGTALGEVLFGKVNPSGHLPMTFEKRWEDNPAFGNYHDADGDKHVAYKEGIFVGYRGYDKLNRDVQYPFGYGLSYTSFALTDLEVGEENPAGMVDVSCRLKNVGKCAGAQVVQVYVGKSGAGVVERPEKELRRFAKVSLKPGESQVVKMQLPKESFMYYDMASKQFVKDAGGYNVMVGFSSRDIKLQKQINIEK